jgi:hypothetical protein
MKLKLRYFWIWICLISLLFPSATPALAASNPAPTGGLLQFQSAGHVLGFAQGELYVSNGTYALHLEFVDAAPVAPQAADRATGSAPAALTKVTYPDLWPGITLEYDAQDGLARSTYRLAPGADPDAIRLRYNAPVKIRPDGSLEITYNNLTISNAAGLNLSSDLSVNGALALTSGNLSTASSNLSLGAGATCSGDYDVLGTTQRTHPINTATVYCLGNPNVQVTVADGSAVPGSLTALLTTGTAPFTGALQRRYTLSAPGFSGTATLRLHYQDAEMTGLTENGLGLYRYNSVAGHWIHLGRTGAVDTTNNWAEKTGVTAFSDWTLADPIVTAVDLYALKANAAQSPLSAWLVGLLLGCGLVIVKAKRTSCSY